MYCAVGIRHVLAFCISKFEILKNNCKLVFFRVNLHYTCGRLAEAALAKRHPAYYAYDAKVFGIKALVYFVGLSKF